MNKILGNILVGLFIFVLIMLVLSALGAILSIVVQQKPFSLSEIRLAT